MNDLLKQPFPKQRFGNIQFRLPSIIECFRFHLLGLLIGVGSQTLQGRNPSPFRTKHCNFRRKFNPYELLTVEKKCPPTKYDYVHFHGRFQARWQFISSSNWDWNPTFLPIPGYQVVHNLSIYCIIIKSRSHQMLSEESLKVTEEGDHAERKTSQKLRREN